LYLVHVVTESMAT